MISVISITGKDRPGIIARVTDILFKCGANLEDASMTILEGEFAMIVLAHFKNGRSCTRAIEAFSKLESRMGLVVGLKGVKRSLKRGEHHRKGTMPWVISVHGKDRSGIVYRVSNLLALRGCNITDLSSRITGRGRGAVYHLVLEADLPVSKAKSDRIYSKLKSLEGKLKVSISAKPVGVEQF